MARFNTPVPGQRTVNLAGGPAYSQTAKQELVSLVLTSFVQDQFYRSESAGLVRLRALIRQNDPLFVAKLAVYARTKYNMRSVTHVIASELAEIVRGGTAVIPAGQRNWLQDFLKAVVVRPDDATEILALHLGHSQPMIGKKGRPYNAVKRGLAAAITKFGVYQLGKYQAKGKTVSLVDLVNLCHPNPATTLIDFGRGSAPLSMLMKGTLPVPETWETMMSATGSVSAEERAAAKKTVWTTLLKSGGLGIMAAVRNARNILEDAPEMTDELCKLITDPERVRKSKMFPFRFQTAINELVPTDTSINNANYLSEEVRKVARALDTAMGISLDNVPDLPGKTLVLLDISWSMRQVLSGKSVARVCDISSLFAAALARKGADVIAYNHEARWVTVNEADSLTTVTKRLSRLVDGGTNIHNVFTLLAGTSGVPKYDRIINLTDEQSWVGDKRLQGRFLAYRQRTDSEPDWFSIDLAGYGSTQLPDQPGVHFLAGFSERIFDVIPLLEEADSNALMREIESVWF